MISKTEQIALYNELADLALSWISETEKYNEEVPNDGGDGVYLCYALADKCREHYKQLDKIIDRFFVNNLSENKNQ